MSLGAFLSSAAGACVVVTIWQAVQWLHRRRRPEPGPGEAICYKCRVIGGRNLRLKAGETTDHLRAHLAIFPGTEVVMSAKWAKDDLP